MIDPGNFVAYFKRKKCPSYNQSIDYGGIFLSSYNYVDFSDLYVMVAYFCHHLSDNYVDLSDLYVDLSVIYVDLSDHYVDL